MRNYVLAFFISLLSLASANNPITVKFNKVPATAEMSGLLKVLDASQVTATIYADSLNSKYYEIWMVECKGNEYKRTKVGYKNIEPGSTKLTFTAIAKDSLNAVISIEYISGAPIHKVAMPTDNHLLIDCDFEWTFNENDTIPLVGYSTGIPQKFKINDQYFDGYYICGVRFSKVNPSKWKDEFKLSDYLYFEAVPVKEMSWEELTH